MSAALEDETRGGGGAVCYVSGRQVPLRHAALLNGTASHTVEFDDIYRYAVYHPGCPTIAAALAAAQTRGADMDLLLRAMIAGYEVSCRIGVAVQPSHYDFWHTTGTVGTFGAAAAVAVALNCDAERTAHAVATCATMASGLQQAFRGEGMSKPLHPGHAAEAGAMAAMAAARGMTGALDVLHGPAGFAAATSEDTGKWEKPLANIGKPMPSRI
jgi:2-methylcitrate dehydratase PrpD